MTVMYLVGGDVKKDLFKPSPLHRFLVKKNLNLCTIGDDSIKVAKYTTNL